MDRGDCWSNQDMVAESFQLPDIAKEQCLHTFLILTRRSLKERCYFGSTIRFGELDYVVLIGTATEKVAGTESIFRRFIFWPFNQVYAYWFSKLLISPLSIREISSSSDFSF